MCQVITVYGSTSQLKSLLQCTENMAECQSEACLLFSQYFLIRLHICMVCASRTALYCNSPTSSKPHGTLVATRLSLSTCKQPRQHLGGLSQTHVHLQTAFRERLTTRVKWEFAGGFGICNCMLPLLQVIASFCSKNWRERLVPTVCKQCVPARRSLRFF